LAGLRAAWTANELSFGGSVAALAEPVAFRRWLGGLYRQDWVVYAKRPFGGAEQVFRYLGRYSHRVAIANSRLVAFEDGQVWFRWKDYADDHRLKVMQLDTEEFIRRFLLHVLPPRFVRIRHFGLLAARNVTTRLERCRELLASATIPPTEKTDHAKASPLDAAAATPAGCPHCQRPLTRYLLPRRARPNTAEPSETPHTEARHAAVDSS